MKMDTTGKKDIKDEKKEFVRIRLSRTRVKTLFDHWITSKSIRWKRKFAAYLQNAYFKDAVQLTLDDLEHVLECEDVRSNSVANKRARISSDWHVFLLLSSKITSLWRSRTHIDHKLGILGEDRVNPLLHPTNISWESAELHINILIKPITWGGMYEIFTEFKNICITLDEKLRDQYVWRLIVL